MVPFVLGVVVVCCLLFGWLMLLVVVVFLWGIGAVVCYLFVTCCRCCCLLLFVVGCWLAVIAGCWPFLVLFPCLIWCFVLLLLAWYLLFDVVGGDSYLFVGPIFAVCGLKLLDVLVTSSNCWCLVVLLVVVLFYGVGWVVVARACS